MDLITIRKMWKINSSPVKPAWIVSTQLLNYTVATYFSFVKANTATTTRTKWTFNLPWPKSRVKRVWLSESNALSSSIGKRKTTKCSATILLDLRPITHANVWNIAPSHVSWTNSNTNNYPFVNSSALFDVQLPSKNSSRQNRRWEMTLAAGIENIKKLKATITIVSPTRDKTTKTTTTGKHNRTTETHKMGPKHTLIKTIIIIVEVVISLFTPKVKTLLSTKMGE